MILIYPLGRYREYFLSKDFFITHGNMQYFIFTITRGDEYWYSGSNNEIRIWQWQGMKKIFLI